MPISRMSPAMQEIIRKKRRNKDIDEYGLDNVKAYGQYVDSYRRPEVEYKNQLKESTEALVAKWNALFPGRRMTKLDVNTFPGRDIAIGQIGTFEEHIDKYNAEHGTNVPIDAYTFKGRAPTDEEHHKSRELRKEWNDKLTRVVQEINNTYFPPPPPPPPPPSTPFLSIEEFVKRIDGPNNPMRWLENGGGRKLRRKGTIKQKKLRNGKKTMKRRL